MYYVYLIECKDKSIYTGITTDLARRFAEHKRGVGGRYTRAHAVKKILYSETYPTRSEASKREARIKSWTRKEKQELARTSPAFFNRFDKRSEAGAG